MNDDWLEYRISLDGSHHVYREQPAYLPRFLEVLKFHAPGLAPVRDAFGAYHVTPNGQAAYESRYIRTFGFYEGRAAVHSQDGWFHILPDGERLYPETHAWCGNFQEGRCTARQTNGRYFHLSADGSPAYEQRYRYAGDFKDGFAVVQRDDGKHSHIGSGGNLVHAAWFLDLDVFHKNHARARDPGGWHHVDVGGQPLYEARFKNVEPFYNGQSRVEGFDGSLLVIDESGEPLVQLRSPLRSHLEELSEDMVGLWKTQAIRAAVELGVFGLLPATPEDIEKSLGLGRAVGPRLMRVLTELGLTRRFQDGTYHPTEKGSHLQRSHPLSMADAALFWGGETYVAWSDAAQSLRTGQSSFKNLYGKDFFDWLQDRPDQLEACHRAFGTYAKHDYQSLAASVRCGVHDHILDAGGGTGELTFTLLRANPKLRGTVMDRPEVVGTVRAPADIASRCSFAPGDFFQEWAVSSDAVILARVLHDWPDDHAVRILRRARDAMPKHGDLYVVEIILDNSSGAGGLLDLNMLVMTGGAERTEAQFRELLAKANFEMRDVVPTSSVSSVIRARAI